MSRLIGNRLRIDNMESTLGGFITGIGLCFCSVIPMIWYWTWVYNTQPGIYYSYSSMIFAGSFLTILGIFLTIAGVLVIRARGDEPLKEELPLPPPPPPLPKLKELMAMPNIRKITEWIVYFTVWFVGPLLIELLYIVYFIPMWKIHQVVIGVEYFNGVITVQSIIYIFWPIILNMTWKEMTLKERGIFIISFIFTNIYLISSVVSLAINSIDPINPEASMNAFSWTIVGFFMSIVLLVMAGLMIVFKTSRQDNALVYKV